MADGILVIIPCGRRKIWDKDPTAGSTRAKDVYAGSPFIVNKSFAEHFGDSWVILSAKYGFIAPDFRIPGPYNVTFKCLSTGPVSEKTLQGQVRKLHLDRFTDVIGFGGREYRRAIESAFDGTSVRLHFPFAGLPIGKAMQAIKRAIAADDPYAGGTT